MYIKKCIVVIVNIEYLEIFNKFLYFYNKNCTFDLIVYTVNFDYVAQGFHRNYFRFTFSEKKKFEINKFIFTKAKHSLKKGRAKFWLTK